MKAIPCLLLLAFGQSALAQSVGSMDLITKNDLLAHLEFIAHDLLEGRDTPSRGLDLATLYVSSQLKLWGATPGGDSGKFFQNVPLVGRAMDPEGSSLSIGSTRHAYGEFMATGNATKFEGQAIYVGHGAQAPELGIDPYIGMDIRGKVLVVRGNPPIELLRSAGSKSVDRIAQDGGAAGIIRISTQGADDWQSSVTSSLAASRPRPAWQGAGPGRQARSSISLSPQLGSKLLQGISFDEAKPKGVAINQMISLETKVKDVSPKTQNVVAIVKGSDPELSNEYVGVSAHIDHVGMRSVAPGLDGIFNGADDDGSGTVAVLELAHAFATGRRPKRSIIFIWHCGEEKGLWGSAYFTNNPTVPLKDLTALINIDMIGRSRPAGDTNPKNSVLSGPNQIYVVGSYKLSRDFGDFLQTVNSKNFNLGYSYKYDDPNDRENIYERSDHYNYALKGIPIAFYFDGVHEDYHQVGDEVHKIDFDKMEVVTKTIYASLWELANRTDRVKLD
ncbi:MAG: M28 family peptidase [Chthonomonas sp.]|nr:M28 family peptidase [Chthonomonas sp.]